MVRQARLRARLSQTDLARRAGVAQSVISAYESDRFEPSPSWSRPPAITSRSRSSQLRAISLGFPTLASVAVCAGIAGP
jgi:predicted transcriptional regulator